MGWGTRIVLLAAGLSAAGIGTVVWVSRTSTPAVELTPDDPAAVALGRQIYDVHCASCHGADLEGQANWRERDPDGRLPAPPHDAGGHTWHHPDGQLFDLTKYGPAAVAGGAYESDMPGFAGTLTDEQIVAVLSFIKSTWPSEVRARHDQINQRATP